MEVIPIKVAIADDHKAVRQALIRSLSVDDEFRFVIEAPNGKELLSRMAAIEPDVVILDIQMPEMNGIETLRLIRQLHKDIRVLMLSAFPNEVFILQCLELGINGFLSKDVEISEIARAIHAAYRNEMYNSMDLSRGLLRNYALKFEKSNREYLPVFSQEEIRILELMRDEIPTEEISRKCVSANGLLSSKGIRCEKKPKHGPSPVSFCMP
jgi:DNA-binding NarL/FixJ family response regulator